MTSSKFPDFLSDCQLPFEHFDDLEAIAREQVDGLTVSSISKALIQCPLGQSQESRGRHKATSSLTSISAATVLEELNKSNDIEADLKTVADTLTATVLRQLLRDPRAPYHVLRGFHSLPLNYVTRDAVDEERRAVDIDESILRNERHIRFISGLANTDEKYLVRLEEFANTLAPSSGPDKPLTFTREDPPNGGLEVLDAFRQRTMQIQHNDNAYSQNFERITKGALRGLHWDNLLVAGNIALNALLTVDLARPGNTKNAAIDIFLYGLTLEGANRKVAQIYRIWHNNLPDKASRVLKYDTAIDFIANWPHHSVHIVLKLFQSPTEILLNFHLDAYAIGYNGHQVLMLPRCARALETGYSLFTMDLIWDHSQYSGRDSTQELDIFTHAYCGFGIRVLPSYAKSLEYDNLSTQSVSVINTDVAENLKGNSSMASRRQKVGAREPGLKTLKRITHMAKGFAQRFQGAGIELDDLFPPLTARRRHLPGSYPCPGMDSFESFMRCCEVWTLHSCHGLK